MQKRLLLLSLSCATGAALFAATCASQTWRSGDQLPQRNVPGAFERECGFVPANNASPYDLTTQDTIDTVKCGTDTRSISIEKIPKRDSCTFLNGSGAYIFTATRSNDLESVRNSMIGRIMRAHPGVVPSVLPHLFGILHSYIISFSDELGCRHVDIISISGPNIIHSRLVTSAESFQSSFLRTVQCHPRQDVSDCPAHAAASSSSSSVKINHYSRRILEGRVKPEY